MIHSLNKLIMLLQKLNEQLSIELITPEQVADGQEQILYLENDIRDLINAISNDTAIENQEKIEKTLVYIHIALARIIGDLQDMHEIVAKACQRLSKLDDQKTNEKK